jgi:hypothetical protein
MVAIAGLIFTEIVPAIGQTGEQEQDPEAIVKQVCYSLRDQSYDSDEHKRNKTQMCELAIRQGMGRGNAEFIEKLETVLNRCKVTDSTSAGTRNHIYAATKPVIEWTEDDFASIVRYMANCSMLKSNQNDMLSLAVAMYEAAGIGLSYYVVDARQARAQIEYKKEMAERSNALEEQRAAHVRRMAQAGYEVMSLLNLRVDAKSLHGKKVAVRGLVQVMDNETAFMAVNERDSNGIVILFGESSRETRRMLLSRCSSRPCRIEVKGTVVGDRPVVGLLAE